MSKAKDNYDRYCYARDNGHTDYVKKDTKCRSYFFGDQWDSTDIAKLAAQGRPALTLNKVFSTIVTVMGEQIATRADISFQPTATGDPETATALDKMWLYTARTNGFAAIEEQVFDAAIIGSRGYFDVRPSFDDNMRGEARISYRKPRNVIPDPDASSYDTKDWNEVFVTQWLTPQKIGTEYSQSAGKELLNRSGSQFAYGYDSIDGLVTTFAGVDTAVGMSKSVQQDPDSKIRRIVRVIERQFKEAKVVDHFVDTETGDTRVIPETWDRDRISAVVEQYQLAVVKKRVEQIRWLVTADDIVLHDSVSPLENFTIVPYFPYFIEGQTSGIVEHLLSPQDLLNKTSSQELHVVNTTANSGYMVKSGALVNMDIEDLEARGAETGLVIELNDMDGLDKIQPNQVPTGLDRIAYKADEFLKEISGVPDSLRGFDRADVAAKAIQAKQQAGSVNLTKPLQNLILSRHMVARNVLEIFQKFYTEERTFRITGEGLQADAEDITVNQMQPDGSIVNDLTLGEYEIIVTDVPNRDAQQDSQFQEAIQLRELGVPIPDDVLIENSHLNRKMEIAQQLREKNESSESEQQMAELEVAIKQLEAEKLKAETMEKKANSALILARAQTEAVKDGEGEAGNQAAVQQQELLMEREKIVAELKLQREKIEAEIALKQFESEKMMEIKREESRMNTLIKAKQQEEATAIKVQQTESDTLIKAQSQEDDSTIKAKQQDDAAKLAAKAPKKPDTGDKK